MARRVTFSISGKQGCHGMTKPLVEAVQEHLPVNGKAYWPVGGRTPVPSGSLVKSRKYRDRWDEMR